jgi:hypothetical protein
MQQQQTRNEVHPLAVPHHRVVQRVRAQHAPERGDAVVRREHGQAREGAAYVLHISTHRARMRQAREQKASLHARVEFRRTEGKIKASIRVRGKDNLGCCTECCARACKGFETLYGSLCLLCVSWQQLQCLSRRRGHTLKMVSAALPSHPLRRASGMNARTCSSSKWL